MRNVIVNYLKEIARNKTKRRRTLMLVSMLSLVVALSVFWQLRIVGISMTGEALCGKLEHTHTLDCLVMEYVCGQEESEVHAHTDECYTSETTQICQKEAHTHSDDCQLEREQLCELEEHQHGEQCVETENVLICTDQSEDHVHITESVTETVQICQREEHSHSGECMQKQEQTCELEEHLHGEACVKTENRLICTDASEEHEHTDECFTAETVQICQKQEHSHSDACQTKEVCICGLEEHRHDDACFETVTLPACFEVRTTQVCEREEHTHTEGECWVLTPCTCEKEEHQHEDACFETTDKLTCGKEESEGHTHTPECQREVNGCGYEEEHKHTLLCYSNAEADLETAADWEASLPALTGNARQDLVSVANSQVGYTESEQNYKVADDNATKMGYTRYGEWYGNPYGNWNGMFVSFCLKYSGHPDYAKLKNTGVETMRLAAVNADKYTAVGPDTVPSAGSIVFMDKNGNGSADCAAVVTYVGSSTITVVEGDLNGAVAKMEYAMSNGTIMGYALLPPRQTQNEATQPTDEATQPTDEATQPTDEATQPTDEATQPTDEATQPTDEATQPTDEATQPTDEATQPTDEATQPTDEATQPTDEATQPTDEATQPTDEATQPTDEATQPTDEYTLNYVCGCSGDHVADITAQRSTFDLKREPAEPSVPTDATVHDTTCENYGKTFAGWYVKNGETGEEIDFNEDTPLVDDYADPDADGTINVYARWAATPAGDTVTVTFVIDTETTETVVLNVNDVLGEDNYWAYVPWVDDLIFAYWKTEDETAVFEDTPITEDMTLYPDMREIVTVIFEFSEYTVDMQIPKGTALGEQFDELDLEEFEGKNFLGWVEKDGEDSTDYLTAETVLYEDATYVPAFDIRVTLTFMNGEGDSVVEFKVVGDIPQGALVWDYLPEEVPPYTGNSELPMEFAGWGRKNGETVELVTETTVADADTVLYAVFEEATSYKVYLHDMAPNGTTDYQQESSNGPIVLAAEMTLQQYLNGNSYHLHHDGKSAAECKWYIKQTVDGNETYVAYDLTTPVTTELHLYTFHYTVTLTRQEATAAASLADVEISADGNMLTLTLREGEKPAAADFVVNGMDYSLYRWTYMDGDQQKTLDISQIIANGVTKSITATSDSDTLIISPSQTGTKTIRYYAFVDGSRVKVAERTATVYRFGNNRWYVPAATLESAYGKYGFTASQMTAGTRYFPHVDWNGSDIWADTPVREVNGVYFSPVISNDNSGCDVYYLPNQTLGATHNQYTNYLNTDTFYTITVSDLTHIFFGTDEEIPPVQYVLTGGTATVTLPSPSEENGTQWFSKGYPLTGTSNADGTTTYTFSDVTEPIRIVAIKDNQVDITYDINLGSYDPASTEPTINGGKTYVEPVQLLEDGRYIVRTPSRLKFTIDNNNALKTILFKGWAVNGDPNQMLNAGEILSAVQLRQYGNGVRLVAQWEAQSFSYVVSFYVNLGLHVVDYNGSSIPTTENKDYTSALYGTTLKISPEPTSFPNSVGTGNYVGDGGGVVLSGTDTAAIDSMIRQFATQSITAKYGSGDDYIDREFTLDSFPDDEQLLVEIRNLQAGYIADYQAWKQSHPDGTVNDYRAAHSDNKIIAIDGEYIPSEELTENNYTIRWFVFKHDTGNGWHIDGTLVKKQGQITVRKTFSGYDPAIAEVIDPNRENPYHISVKDDTNKTVTTLILSNTDTTDGMGYQSYDAATKTYTWVVPLTAGKTFTFFENNYASREVVGGETVASLAEYMVTNSTSDVYRTKYNPANGVSVMARGHNVDQSYSTYETVTFFNSYIPTAAVPLSKVDDYGNPLPGVSFSLHKDGKKCEIYKDRAGIYYIYEPTDKETTFVDGGYITVDQQGYALVMGLKDIDENGNYSDYIFELEESVTPGGYASVDDISFEITDQGEIRLTGDTTSVTLVDGEVLRVTNASKTMDVTVVKNWEGQKETVVVQLVQNGNPLTSKTATLNDENGWTYTWEDMPIYVSGALAEYTIKETWIGETAYRGTYDDGYEGYIVVVSAPETVDEDGDGLPERATITVNNSVYLGGVQFKKIDEKGNGLANAGFQLYTDEACEDEYGIGVRSDLRGNVNFGYLVVGTYYMKEVVAPAGYQANTTLYKIVVTGSGTTLTVNGSDTPISTIVNTPATASLKLRKVDTENNPLDGAKFKVMMLVNSETNAWEEVIRGGKKEYEVVNTDGFLVIPDLLPGEYQLIEIVAPAGYNRRTEPIPFTVALADISASDTDPNNGWRFEVVKDGNGVVTDKYIVVENVPGIELPKTGGLGTAPVVMTGLFMMAASLYVFLLRRKRERGTE